MRDPEIGVCTPRANRGKLVAQLATKCGVIFWWHLPRRVLGSDDDVNTLSTHTPKSPPEDSTKQTATPISKPMPQLKIDRKSKVILCSSAREAGECVDLLEKGDGVQIFVNLQSRQLDNAIPLALKLNEEARSRTQRLRPIVVGPVDINDFELIDRLAEAHINITSRTFDEFCRELPIAASKNTGVFRTGRGR